jgi:hypothetical protein
MRNGGWFDHPPPLTIRPHATKTNRRIALTSLPNLTRRHALKLGTGALVAGALTTSLDPPAEASPYGLEAYPRTEDEIGDHPPVLWETETVLIGLPNHRNPDELGRSTGRQVFITAYADGSGRIAMTRVPTRTEPGSEWLFGDERPFIAARIDPATFQALWLGLFAETLDEPMPDLSPTT